MRLLLTALLTLCALTAQEYDLSADIHDGAIIEVTLYRSITAEEIHKAPQEFERQADELIEASQRRVKRQEERINAAIERQAPPEEMAVLREEFQKRMGIAYDALSRAEVLREIARSAKHRGRATGRSYATKTMTKFVGSGYFTDVDQRIVAKAFLRRFGRPLPISANGETHFHRSKGFDHAGRLDVALTPDQVEGMWLCSYLRSMGIPFFAFRGAIAGKASGAHIHIGPASERLLKPPQS